jgi:DNA invertase Pin-like site-specific DNA recombinase
LQLETQDAPKTKELTLMNAVNYVALYARVSTHDKDQNPETQLRPLRAHLDDLSNASLVGTFVDQAGADDLRGRRAWRQLLTLASKRQVDLIVVWKLDRAFRSVVDGATTLQALRQCGCGIRSLQEPWIDTTTPVGEALYHITLAWAQLEKRQLAERVKAGMERARAEGRSIGRPRRAQPVTEHPRWPTVLQALEAGHLTRTEAAKKLRVRKASLIAALAVVESAEGRDDSVPCKR